MKNKWQLSIELDDGILTEIEKEYSISLPKELKEFLIDNNASTPTYKYFDTITSKEEVISNILDFNSNSIESFKSVYDNYKNTKLSNNIPFGKDGFGNYICIDAKTGKILFYDHENQKMIHISNTFEEFINSLYGEVN